MDARVAILRARLSEISAAQRALAKVEKDIRNELTSICAALDGIALGMMVRVRSKRFRVTRIEPSYAGKRNVTLSGNQETAPGTFLKWDWHIESAWKIDPDQTDAIAAGDRP